MLERYRHEELDLEGLVEAVAELLARMPVTPEADGRVSAVPDARTIRYYQTLGIVSKPLRYAGRQATYGYRHLLEVLSVKLLQGRGLSLAQVQRALAGATEQALGAAVAEALREQASLGESGLTAASLMGMDGDFFPQETSPAKGSAFDRLLAAEVAPGVVVTIDPNRVTDPAAVLERLTRAVKGTTQRSHGEPK